MSAGALHFAFATLVLVAYTVLTVLGHDANELFGLLLGQAAGAGIAKVGK